MINNVSVKFKKFVNNCKQFITSIGIFIFLHTKNPHKKDPKKTQPNDKNPLQIHIDCWGSQ